MKEVSVGLTVLLASSGNESSLYAAEQVRRLILPRTRALTVLSVAPLAGVTARLTRSAPEKRTADLEEAAEAAAYTLGFITEPEDRITTRVKWGVPQDEILAAEAETKPDLLVLGRRDPNPLRDLVSAGTAMGVLARARQPILLARRDDAEIPTVVVPFIDAPGFSAALGWLRRLEIPYYSSLVLTGSLEPIPAVPGMLFTYREHVQRTRKSLQQAQRPLIERPLGRAQDALSKDGFVPAVDIREESFSDLLTSHPSDLGATILIIGVSHLLREEKLAMTLRAISQLSCSVLFVRAG